MAVDKVQVMSEAAAREIAQCYEEIRELKSLLVRAADALQDWCSALPEDQNADDRNLIAELRKAAE